MKEELSRTLPPHRGRAPYEAGELLEGELHMKRESSSYEAGELPVSLL
jgi:hypothetical protein